MALLGTKPVVDIENVVIVVVIITIIVCGLAGFSENAPWVVG